MRIILILLITSVLWGCASLGPVSSSGFENYISDSIPSESGMVTSYGPGIWVPNTMGFNDTRSAGLFSGQEPVPGILVITESALFVVQWDNDVERYRILKRFLLENVEEIDLDRYGLNRRVVIQWSDYSTDSFSFTSDSGQMIDRDKTEEMFQTLSTNAN